MDALDWFALLGGISAWLTLGVLLSGAVVVCEYCDRRQRVTNCQLSQELKRLAAYADNEGHRYDAEYLREAARRLRGEPLDEATLTANVGAAVEHMTQHPAA